MKECRERFLHTYRRTTSAYISSEGEQLFHGYHLGLLVAGHRRGLFDVDLTVAGDNTHKQTRALAP